MDLKVEPVSSILNYLSTQYEGKSVFEISTSLEMNRNLVSKYLSILLMQGRVELKSHGTMKEYRLSNRIPFSLLFRLNESFLIGIDQFFIIKECFGELPPFFYADKKLQGKRIQTTGHPGIHDELVLKDINLALNGQGPFNHQIHIASYWHQIKIIPVIYDNRTIGVALSFSDITLMKDLESAGTFWKFRYLALTEKNPDMVLHLSLDGKITSANPAYLTYHQISKDDIIGTTVLPGLMAEDQKKLTDSIHSLSPHNPHTEIIHQVILKNGSIQWIRWNIIGIFLNQNLIEIHLQGSDITKEKKIEQKFNQCEFEFQSLLDEKKKEILEVTQELAREREERKILKYQNQLKKIGINSLLESSQNVILKINNLGIIQNINAGFSKILDYPSDELIGTDIRELLFPADAHVLGEKIHLLSTKFEPITQLELKFQSKNGSPVYVELSGVPKLSRDKKKLAINCIGPNITRRKIMEQEFKKLVAIMDKTSDIIQIYNENGNLQYINQAGRRMLEIPESTSIHTYHITQFIQKTSQKDLDFGLKIASDKGVWKGEINQKSLSGRDIQVSEEIITYRDSPDDPLIYLIVGRDISERMVHHQELSRINAYNRDLLDTNVDTLVFIGLDGIILDANKSIERITGYHRDELIGLKFNRYIISPEKAEEAFMRVVVEGVVRNYPLKILHRNGQITPVECNASLFRDENRNIMGVFASVRDIIPPYQMDKDQLLTYTYYLVNLKDFPYPFIRFGVDGKPKFLNKAFFEFTWGISDENISPDSTLEIHPHDRERFLSLQIRSYQDHQPFIVKFRHKYKDRSYRWVKFFSKPLFSINGEFIGIIGTFIQTYDEKEASEQIQEKDLRIQNLITNMPIGVVISDVWGGCILVNQEWTCQSEVSLKEAIGVGWVQRLQPEDLDLLLTKWNTTIDSEEKWGFNYRFLMNNGETVLVCGVVHQIPGSDGTTIRYYGFNVDIIQKKWIEDRMVENDEQIWSIEERGMEGTWTLNSEGYTSFANQRMAEILGYSPEEMKGKHLFTFMDEEGIQIATTLLNHRKQGKSEEHDFIFIHKQGHQIFTRLSTSPIMDSFGNYLGAVALVMVLSEILP